MTPDDIDRTVDGPAGATRPTGYGTADPRFPIPEAVPENQQLAPGAWSLVIVPPDHFVIGGCRERPSRWVRFWQRVLLGWRWERESP